MDNESFKRLTANIRRKWDRVRGLLVVLDSGSGGVCRLTAGPSSNSGLVLEKVKLWSGEDLRKECAPGDKELQKALTSMKVCRACVTYVDVQGRHKRPAAVCWMCLGNQARCGVDPCPARGRLDAE